MDFSGRVKIEVLGYLGQTDEMSLLITSPEGRIRVHLKLYKFEVTEIQPDKHFYILSSRSKDPQSPEVIFE